MSVNPTSRDSWLRPPRPGVCLRFLPYKFFFPTVVHAGRLARLTPGLYVPVLHAKVFNRISTDTSVQLAVVFFSTFKEIIFD